MIIILITLMLVLVLILTLIPIVLITPRLLSIMLIVTTYVALSRGTLIRRDVNSYYLCCPLARHAHPAPPLPGRGRRLPRVAGPGETW